MNALTYATELALVEHANRHADGTTETQTLREINAARIDAESAQIAMADAAKYIPPIANFSPREIIENDLDQQEFEEELDALAFEMDGELTNVGRYFDDEYLSDVKTTEAAINEAATIMYRNYPWFRSEYAGWSKNTVIQRLTERRARLDREANMREED